MSKIPFSKLLKSLSPKSGLSGFLVEKYNQPIAKTARATQGFILFKKGNFLSNVLATNFFAAEKGLKLEKLGQKDLIPVSLTGFQ